MDGWYFSLASLPHNQCIKSLQMELLENYLQGEFILTVNDIFQNLVGMDGAFVLKTNAFQKDPDIQSPAVSVNVCAYF